MFDVLITNTSLSKTSKFKVMFPNWSEICGDTPRVSMISLDDGSILFDTNDVMYAINDWDNGTHGNNYTHVRDVIQHFGGSGKVVIFRRGGIYADIQAMISIMRRIFSEQRVEVPRYCQVSRPSVLKALLSCPPAKYADMEVDASKRIPISFFTAVVPSTIKVSKHTGVVGVPVKRNPVEPMEERDGTPANEKATPSEAPEELAVAKPTNCDPIALLSAAQELVRQLTLGKKIVITLGLE